MQMTSPHFPVWLGIAIPILVLIMIWDATWKAIGMWKSARHNQLGWFVCILIFNTAGILPIIYLLWGQRDRNLPQPVA